MKSFNSFKDIINDALKLFDVIENKYLAHIYLGNGFETRNKNNETLKEHSVLVADYLLRLVETNKVETIVDNIIDKLLKSLRFSSSQNVRSRIKQVFVCSIIYHDLGKINPNFQNEKMQNEAFQKEKLEIKHYHSFLGAFIFVNIFFKKILNDEELEDNELHILLFILLLFSNPISKHHSSKLYIEKEFKLAILDEVFSFLKEYKIELERDFGVGIFVDFEIIRDTFNEFAQAQTYFSLFALLKLSYSLLTACDYYATNEYMAGIVVNDFGTLGDKLKEKISKNLKTKQTYNNDLFANFNNYLDKPFSEIEEQSNKNLNILRQKLNAEVISTLRQNPDNPWYYIEAPTGAGKTNLSLACISELLQLDKTLNKVFYVFPFTTLITQTYKGIQDTIGLGIDEMIQLHSRAGFHSNEEAQDGKYGEEKRIYLDNLFVNYPFCVTSHVRFFDIIKGNNKESNYLLHRLCNSIVVIDELQTYNPDHWDKMVYFIENYARLFNMRFIMMSATLPKIDALSESTKGNFINLTPNKKQYFSNKNFAGRIDFDFSLLEIPKPTKENKETYLRDLSLFMKNEADKYVEKYGHSRVLIEFITKNTASYFFRLLLEDDDFSDFKIYILSGDILEPQRKKVIQELKDKKYDKVILVSTQVVEAGVDIDMDLGFKDRSLLDSDEQLAGRVNRNASKKDCKVFLFDCDRSSTIYGKDKRYQHQQRDQEIYSGFKEILQKKEFDKLYEKVFEDAKKEDWTDCGKLESYLENFARFDFDRIHKEFQLIENNGSQSVFIPLDIDIPEGYTKDQIKKLGILSEGEEKLSGEKLFDKYISVIMNKEEGFTEKQIDLKKLTGLMSQFTISLYPNVKNKLTGHFDEEKGKFGYLYLSHWNKCYKLEEGFDFEKAEQDIIF